MTTEKYFISNRRSKARIWRNNAHCCSSDSVGSWNGVALCGLVLGGSEAVSSMMISSGIIAADLTTLRPLLGFFAGLCSGSCENDEFLYYTTGKILPWQDPLQALLRVWAVLL